MQQDKSEDWKTYHKGNEPIYIRKDGETFNAKGEHLGIVSLV